MRYRSTLTCLAVLALAVSCSTKNATEPPPEQATSQLPAEPKAAAPKKTWVRIKMMLITPAEQDITFELRGPMVDGEKFALRRDFLPGDATAHLHVAEFEAAIEQDLAVSWWQLHLVRGQEVAPVTRSVEVVVRKGNQKLSQVAVPPAMPGLFAISVTQDGTVTPVRVKIRVTPPAFPTFQKPLTCTPGECSVAREP